MLIRKFIILFIFTAFLPAYGQYDYYIGNIYIDNRPVFEKGTDDWFFAAPLLNALHVTTKPFVISDELLFKEGELLDERLLSETERNLRATGLFTDAGIELDSIDHTTYDVYVVTEDKWSLYPYPLFGTGGGYTRYGGRLNEKNFLGLGADIFVEALHRSENDIGWQGQFYYNHRRIFRSEFTFFTNIIANKFKTLDTFRLEKPYRTLSTNTAYGAEVINNFGSDFLYRGDSLRLLGFHEKRAKGWFSNAWWRKDRVFITGLVEWQDVERPSEEFSRAYDNTGSVLAGFGSIAREFYTVDKVNSYLTEDLVIGGWGQAVIGRGIPIGSGGESLFYVGGRGEQSYYTDELYLFGQLTGASAFSRNRAKNTYFEILGHGFYRLSESLVLGARVRHQNVWNWDGLRQLILDTDYGIRGYRLNEYVGDNRLISNLELRFFPDLEFWIINVSGSVFVDAGAVWNQDTDLIAAPLKKSAGIGLQLHNMKSSGPGSVFRIDLAYNFEENKFGEVILSSDWLFSFFKNHVFELPQIFGLEFDSE